MILFDADKFIVVYNVFVQHFRENKLLACIKNEYFVYNSVKLFLMLCISDSRDWSLNV